MNDHWIDRLFEMRPDQAYAHLPCCDNVHVRRLADAQRCLQSLRFAEPEIETERKKLLDVIRRTFDRMADPQVALVVAGDWNAGKSTLINALLGEHWLPVNVTRETLTITRILAGPQRRIRVLFRDRRPPLELPHDYPSEDFVHHRIKQLGEQHRDVIERIDVFYPDHAADHAFLKWVALLDTPGLDFSEDDDQVSQPVIEDADALLWVMHLEGPRQSDLTVLRDFRRRNPESPILAVANYADLLDEGESEGVLADMQARLSEVAEAVFLVSAQRDLRARDSDPGFRQLRAYLYEHLVPAYGELRWYRRPRRLARDCLEQVQGFANWARNRPLEDRKTGGE